MHSSLLFQAYVESSDQEFVLATVRSIGRCASMVPQISETCLRGLLRLMSRKNGLVLIKFETETFQIIYWIYIPYFSESLVGESVVVMRKLLQMQVRTLFLPNFDYFLLTIRLSFF